MKPKLELVTVDGISYHTDEELAAKTGIRIAFSNRLGGISDAPYSSLNLGLHVGDDPIKVWDNRRRFLTAAGLDPSFVHLTASANQTHSTNIKVLGPEDSRERIIFDDTDAFVTDSRNIPMLLCFADCVPVILASTTEPSVVAVVHSGWKGTLDDIVGLTLDKMLEDYNLDPKNINAYIGAFICKEELTLGLDIAMQFSAKFEKIAEALQEQAGATPIDVNASYNVDLEMAIRESLERRGVADERIASLGKCTAQDTEHYFSYRAEQGLTGRQGALAFISS